MHITSLHFYFLLLPLALFSCRQAPSQGLLQLGTGHEVVFLDSLQAAQAIVRDEDEGFFEKISPLDMSIQMGRLLPDTFRREELLKDYREFLRQDVESFSEEDQKLLREAFQKAFALTEQLEPGLFPASIRLIKTKALHYGPSVYYTREDCIIIPENEIAEGNLGGLTRVMLHEVFHIYSRQHPEERDALYRLIGFEPVTQPLVFPDSLARRLLLNPDGIDVHYAITIKPPGDSLPVRAIPLIVSTAPNYTPALPEFFGYLDFWLYPIREEAGSYQVIARGGHRSPLPSPSQIPDFFKQIGDNTDYIIHPDEVLADNFVFLVLAQTGAQNFALSNYSERGQEVLRGMEKVLKGK
ncbi:MAG: hypothetical protein KDD19_28830 [Phaeodactylibacter sp.]|nr:hypothetical protein [Phaeodactylibacter sp.]MCB9048596.1 hypothetical protein [Lewinellaceae bacterium]